LSAGLVAVTAQGASSTAKEVQIMPKQRKPAPASNRNSRNQPRPAKHTKAKSSKPPPSLAPTTAAARPSKKASVLGLLQRPQGAAIGELTEATGWQPHSVRAVLTGFRTEGKELIRAKGEGGTTRYRISVEA
jgi:hypothetical protein